VTGPGERRRGKAVAVKHEREEEQEVAVVAAAEEPLKHVNFFEDLELQQRAEDTVFTHTHHRTRTRITAHAHAHAQSLISESLVGTAQRNPEHEAEKKAQADRDARFYTTYLGQSAAETQSTFSGHATSNTTRHAPPHTQRNATRHAPPHTHTKHDMYGRG
jgi:hypothetical protein